MPRNDYNHGTVTTNEPTSPISPVAVYPPPTPPDDENAAGTAAEFYGFVAWATTAILWFVYIFWALLPDSVIRGMGITWYPNRWVFFTFVLKSNTDWLVGNGHFSFLHTRYSLYYLRTSHILRLPFTQHLPILKLNQLPVSSNYTCSCYSLVADGFA
jgi:hypothetical protein